MSKLPEPTPAEIRVFEIRLAGEQCVAAVRGFVEAWNDGVTKELARRRAVRVAAEAKRQLLDRQYQAWKETQDANAS